MIFLFFVKYGQIIHKIGLDERNSMVQTPLQLGVLFRSGVMPSEITILLEIFCQVLVVIASGIGVNVIVKLEPTMPLIFCSNMVELYIRLKVLMREIQWCFCSGVKKHRQQIP